MLDYEVVCPKHPKLHNNSSYNHSSQPFVTSSLSSFLEWGLTTHTTSASMRRSSSPVFTWPYLWCSCRLLLASLPSLVSGEATKSGTRQPCPTVNNNSRVQIRMWNKDRSKDFSSTLFLPATVHSSCILNVDASGSHTADREPRWPAKGWKGKSLDYVEY